MTERSTDAAGDGRAHLLLRRSAPGAARALFTTALDGSEFFLRDHRIHGRRILPAAAYVEIVRAAATEPSAGEGAGHLATNAVGLYSLLFPRPLFVNGPCDLRIEFRREPGGPAVFEVHTDADGARATHCRGRVRSWSPAGASNAPIDIEAVKRECAGPADATALYERLRRVGLEYGPAHRGIVSLAVGPGTVLARVVLPECVRSMPGRFGVHPAMLDAALQAVQALAGEDPPPEVPAVPFAVRELTIAGATTGSMWAVIRRHAGAEAGRVGAAPASTADIDLCDDAGTVVVSVHGYATRALPRTGT